MCGCFNFFTLTHPNATFRFLGLQNCWNFQVDLLKVALSTIFSLRVAALFDYAAAFPSVSHAWLLAVLHKIKIPKGVLNALHALYEGNEGYSNIGGLITWIFSVGCGVLQGCPLSGSLFVIAIDPLLHLFEKYIVSPGWGHLYACADDIGASLFRLEALSALFRLFERMRKASGLTLKP